MQTKHSKTSREFSYNGELARWWLKRSTDDAHVRAYGKIADFIRASYVREPKVIVDYACGTGCLLALLSDRFPRTRLVGLDGSNVLLGLALRRLANLPRSCARRISLIETPLPNFNLLRGRADLAIFCFPNMIPFSLKETAKLKGHGLSKTDRMVARSLSLAGDPHNDEREAGDPRAIQHTMEQSRQISLNLRRLLADDGICMRIEYATVQRHELSPLELTQVSFEEGSLDTEVEAKMPRQWFRVLASSYFRSRVLGDVYEQTADERDRNGGYLITVLRAI